MQVFESIEKALSHLVTSSTGQASIGRIFVIGGAQLYTDLLNLDSSLATVDKLLVTRILAPRYECDAYFPEFRTQEQFKAEVEHASKAIKNQGDTTSQDASDEKDLKLLKQQEWTKASADSLRQYLGSSCPAALADSPDMVTSEGETWYEYQLWERRVD